MDIGRAFIEQSRQLLTDSYLPRIEQAVNGLPANQVWWRANPQSNSIGNLILHLDGNVRQWIISGLGGAPDTRERQREFETDGGLDANDLLLTLHTTVVRGGEVLGGIDRAELLAPRRIQSYDVTVLSAVFAVVEHFSMHTGQILLLAKMWKGDLALYDYSKGQPRPQWRGGVVGH
ncbi:MAG: DUF1572 family protein [Vicinamibacterales bacterium]